jgi:hypothetical protein
VNLSAGGPIGLDAERNAMVEIDAQRNPDVTFGLDPEPN